MKNISLRKKNKLFSDKTTALKKENFFNLTNLKKNKKPKKYVAILLGLIFKDNLTTPIIFIKSKSHKSNISISKITTHLSAKTFIKEISYILLN